MRELSYIILRELGCCSLGIAQQVLYSNGDICVRIQVDKESDTEQFRRLIQFLYAQQMQGLPEVIKLGQISGHTILVVSSQSGECLREVLQKRPISSAKLDKWWNQMREITSVLAKQGLYLGTFTPDALMVSKDDELLIPLFSRGDNRIPKSDNLAEIEKLFIAAVSQEISVATPVEPVSIPRRSQMALNHEIADRGKSSASSYRQALLKGLRWLPTIILGIACLVSFSRVSSWADSSPSISEKRDLITNSASTLDSPEFSTTISEVSTHSQEVIAAKKLIASNVSIETIDEEYAKKLLTALEVIRDHALNNLDYSEFIGVNVVGSSAADTESKLFHNLLDSGYRLKKYKMSFSQVKILQNSKEQLVIRAKISQDEFLKCAVECVSISPGPSQLVEIVLVPRPWRIRQIVRQN